MVTLVKPWTSRIHTALACGSGIHQNLRVENFEFVAFTSFFVPVHPAAAAVTLRWRSDTVFPFGITFCAGAVACAGAAGVIKPRTGTANQLTE
jgi:hypothetical protein